jgi:uncharacterized repeat protein (TIGR02543 family)
MKKDVKLSIVSLFVLILLSVVLVECGGGGGGGYGGGGGGGATTYTVTYNGNGNTGGSVPTDSNNYTLGQSVTVLGNTGSLVKTGFTFAGWNTLAAGSGTTYTAGQTFSMGTANVTLYAIWTSTGGGGSGYTVTYDANGATGGTVPVDSGSYSTGQTVTVLGNTGSLTNTGYTFAGWQTKADGSGKAYTPGKTFAMGGASVTMYALWAGGYAYAVNWSDSNVSQYTIGPNGALTPMFTPAVSTQGYDPRFLTVDPLGKYLYVSNYHGVNPYITACTYGCGFVSQFTIGADGSLTSLSTPTFFTSGPGPGGSAVHPTKPWYYVAQGWSSVSQNIINADGSLTSMATPTVAAGVYPDAIAIDPSGKWAYVVNGDANTVSQYSINQTTGALTSLSTPTAATGHNAFEIKIISIPSGEYAYVANYSDGTISQYSINTTNGMLSQLTPSTVTAIPGGTLALSIAVDPQGRFAYVPINYTSSQVIAQFQINQTTGALVSNGTVSAAGPAAAWIAIESSGKYAYATSGDTGWGNYSIAQYTIDQTTGALTLMSNPTVQAGYGPSEIVTVGK